MAGCCSSVLMVKVCVMAGCCSSVLKLLSRCVFRSSNGPSRARVLDDIVRSRIAAAHKSMQLLVSVILERRRCSSMPAWRQTWIAIVIPRMRAGTKAGLAGLMWAARPEEEEPLGWLHPKWAALGCWPAP